MSAVPGVPADGLGVDVSVWAVRVGDRIIRDETLVTVVDRYGRFGDLYLKWEGTERDSDGIPVMSGITHVRPGEQDTVRLVERPTVVEVPGSTS